LGQRSDADAHVPDASRCELYRQRRDPAAGLRAGFGRRGASPRQRDHVTGKFNDEFASDIAKSSQPPQWPRGSKHQARPPTRAASVFTACREISDGSLLATTPSEQSTERHYKPGNPAPRTGPGTGAVVVGVYVMVDDETIPEPLLGSNWYCDVRKRAKLLEPVPKAEKLFAVMSPPLTVNECGSGERSSDRSAQR
jgi:hypothetical protein